MVALKIMLVGSPNVGKSLLFNWLTGQYAAVSNYPGTTVEVARGQALVDTMVVEVVDTPGIYGLVPATEEEAVTRRVLWEEDFDLLLHVVDTKNLERSLPLTLALMEAGFPLVLVLNMYDEAKKLGLTIDEGELEKRLGIPCIITIGTSGYGLARMEEAVAEALSKSEAHKGVRGISPVAMGISYSVPIAKYLRQADGMLAHSYPFSSRSIALLVLQGDEEMKGWLSPQEQGSIKTLLPDSDSLTLQVAMTRRRASDSILRGLLFASEKSPQQSWLDSLTLNPITGVPLLVLIVYLCLYRFVGVFGAVTVVDFLDKKVFSDLFNPFVDHIVDSLTTNQLIRELIAHEYGVLTLGLRYAVAVVFPIVTTFFFSFALLEDSGYLPRLAYLLDRVFQWVGLSGRAVLPLSLGFGCGTMATLVTRTLETRRERIIATMILALAIPCSAQLGVILALLARHTLALFIWAMTVGIVALAAGLILAHLLPGNPPRFILELPPLRWPMLRNVFRKTATRVNWYFMEIMSLFLLASVLIWLGRVTGALDRLVIIMTPLMARLGLPPSAAHVFLYGFFRRDYGAAGLYDMQSTLSVRQLTVAAVTLTLFIPCIAQFIMMVKERGLATSLVVVACVFPAAFLIGFLLNSVLSLSLAL